MTNHTADRWRRARTLTDIGHLTHSYLTGLTDFYPDQLRGDRYPADPAVTLALADLNAAGFVTCEYLPGATTERSRTVDQRAAVQGFCDMLTLEWIHAGLYGTRFQVLVTSTPVGGFGATLDLNPGVPVLRTNSRTTLRLGKQFTTIEVREALYGGLLSDDAATKISLALNVTIFDPLWNSGDLWLALARIVDPEPMILARERRQALPAA